jgi:hypothetical protein
MMKRANVIAELSRDIHHLRHLVGAVAVIVHEDVSTEHFSKRLEAEITLWWLADMVGVPLIPSPPVRLGLNPRSAIPGHIAHPRRRPSLGVDAFGILTARHLEAVLRTRKFHCLDGARGNHLEHNAATSDQVR